MIENLRARHEEIVQNPDEVQIIHYVRDISSINDIEIINFHFNLLADRRNEHFFYSLRGSFDKHGVLGKEFLLKKIDAETNSRLMAEAVFLLGSYNIKYDQEETTKIITKAKNFIETNDFTYQYYGIIVLGWLGSKTDLEAINKQMVTNENEKLRSYSATSMRQVFYNHARLKKSILRHYYEVLSSDENNEVVVLSVLACTQDLLQKKFGVKENMKGEISGDIVTAKPKAIKALRTFLKIKDQRN